MNSQNDMNFIATTNYFSKPKTWIIRFIQFSIAMLVLYQVDLSEMTSGTQLLYACGALLAMGFVISPVDELALDNNNMYFIKKSFVPFLNRTREYKISTIKRIGFYSIVRAPSVFSLLVPVTNVFRIEFIFNDDSSQSDDLFIHKKDLQMIVSNAKRLLNGAQ